VRVTSHSTKTLSRWPRSACAEPQRREAIRVSSPAGFFRSGGACNSEQRRKSGTSLDLDGCQLRKGGGLITRDENEIEGACEYSKAPGLPSLSRFKKALKFVYGRDCRCVARLVGPIWSPGSALLLLTLAWGQAGQDIADARGVLSCVPAGARVISALSAEVSALEWHGLETKWIRLLLPIATYYPCSDVAIALAPVVILVLAAVRRRWRTLTSKPSRQTEHRSNISTLPLLGR
jgi:hypothetical protein